jgi:glutathione reductase (NADPH)
MVNDVSYDWKKITERARGAVDNCGKGRLNHFLKKGLNLIKGKAQFIDPYTVEVNGDKLRAKHVFIATGAAYPKLPVIGLEYAITPGEIVNMEEVPGKLAIIGGGFIAFEFAYIFNRLGSEVMIFELLDHVLGKIDSEIRERVVRHARGLGIIINTGTAVDSILKNKDGFVIEAKKDGELFSFSTEKVLMAAGRVPAIEGLGLEKAGVEFDKGGILVDTSLRTSQPHIWAIGDVRKGSLQITPPAQYEGRLAAENALSGKSEPINETIVPFFIGTTPPIAGVGLTEQEAGEAGYFVKTNCKEYAGFCPSDGIEGESEGLVKVIYDPESGVILGAYGFGSSSPALIQQIAFAMQCKLSIKQAGQVFFAFPGISQVLHHALL